MDHYSSLISMELSTISSSILLKLYACIWYDYTE